MPAAARPARGGRAAAAQRRRFAFRGYLVFPDLLTPRELNGLRAALAEVLRRARRLTRSNSTFTLVRGPADTRLVSRVRDPITQHRRFHRLAFHPRILDVVEMLIGPNIHTAYQPAGNGQLHARDVFDPGTFGIGQIFIKREGLDQFVTGFRVVR